MTGADQAVGEVSSRIFPSEHSLLDGGLILEFQFDGIQQRGQRCDNLGLCHTIAAA